MHAIEFQKVYFKYAKGLPIVLNDISFQVEYGKITLLSGMSGSGKSTVLSLLSGIIPNVIPGMIKGNIKINDEEIASKSLSEITKEVGIVLQNADYQIIQSRVEDELAFGCENIGMSPNEIKEKVHSAAKAMSLDLKWNTKALSGGQKQRLITASILAMGQKIIVLDEPLANLDSTASKMLLDSLRRLSEEGYAVLIVEHRLDIVLDYADQIFHIEDGKIEEIENKKEYLYSQSKRLKRIDVPYSSDVLFSLQNISYTVKKREILKDISFDIHKGERILLLGENGCGKTTLSKLIAKIIKPTSGTIIQNIDPKCKRGNKRWFSHIGVIYQNPSYELFMPTVYKEIMFAAKSIDIANEVLNLFGLMDLKDRHPQSLSEGQKRKLTVALALASMPEVILLDEPTVGQDYKSLELMINILNDWHKKYGTTMITVTHDIRCAYAFTDKAIWIEDGLVKRMGSDEVINEFFKIV